MEKKMKMTVWILLLGLTLVPESGNAQMLRATTSVPKPSILGQTEDPTRLISAEPVPSSQDGTVKASPIGQNPPAEEVQPEQSGELAQGAPNSPIQRQNIYGGSGNAPAEVEAEEPPTDTAEDPEDPEVPDESDQKPSSVASAGPGGDKQEITVATTDAPAIEAAVSGAGCSLSIVANESSSPILSVVFLLASLGGAIRIFRHP